MVSYGKLLQRVGIGKVAYIMKKAGYKKTHHPLFCKGQILGFLGEGKKYLASQVIYSQGVAEPCMDTAWIYMVRRSILFYPCQFLYIIHLSQGLYFLCHGDILPKRIFYSVYKSFI